MEEKKNLTELTFEEEIVRQFTESENRYRHDVTIFNIQKSIDISS